jgi:nucleoside phosphorylase
VPDLQFETSTPESYMVGIVCALYKEPLAVRALFDSRHSNLSMPRGDTNHYALGRIEQHNVVAACLPSGEYGTNSAADVASHMIRSFPCIKFCLLVGIGGGVPPTGNDIRLGDVVVSWPTDNYSGVIQYDLGKTFNDGQFKVTGFLNRPSRFLMTALSSLRSDPDISPEM